MCVCVRVPGELLHEELEEEAAVLHQEAPHHLQSRDSVTRQIKQNDVFISLNLVQRMIKKFLNSESGQQGVRVFFSNL